MRILIVSDIHGNYDALSSIDETYDELWVLGDLVNYGPEPAAVIDFVRTKAAVIVGGNHDYSIGFNQDPRCSDRFRDMAEVTRRFTDAVLASGTSISFDICLGMQIGGAGTRAFIFAMRFPRTPFMVIAMLDPHAGSQRSIT